MTGAGVMAARVVVAGGHSAGHIEPAMNFADALLRLEPTAEITALGTVRGLDTTLIPARGYPLELIPPSPLPRKLNRALLHAPDRLRDSVLAAEAALDRGRAEVVVGFGGYVAGQAYLAARRQGLPIVVHEANARPGVANRLAARMTTHVFTAAPGVRLAHATAIGIPLRPAITTRSRCRTATRPPPYVVIPYVEEMQYAYAAADFVVCRSGAMTCAELAAVGLPGRVRPAAAARR